MRSARLNRFISALSHHLLLSLLWLAGCLPVVTAPVATAALLAAAGQRGAGGEPSLSRSFAGAFRRLLRPALATGLGWAAIGAVLLADLLIAGRIGAPAGDLVRVAVLALLLLYGLATAALFPVLVAYHAPPLHLARTAVVVALLFPAHSLAGLLAVATAAVVMWTVPVTVLIVPSLAATLLHRLFDDAFARLRSRAGTAATGTVVTGTAATGTVVTETAATGTVVTGTVVTGTVVTGTAVTGPS